MTKADALHRRLSTICRSLPSDYEPYGSRERDGTLGDCSSGCRWYLPLRGKIGMDWGVCSCRESPRCSLLTFEHQGCEQFERGR